MNTLVLYALVLAIATLSGIVAMILWPRRRTPEARAFVVTALLNLVVIGVMVLIKKWKERRK